jgi:hypothetical protein
MELLAPPVQPELQEKMEQQVPLALLVQQE